MTASAAVERGWPARGVLILVAAVVGLTACRGTDRQEEKPVEQAPASLEAAMERLDRRQAWAERPPLHLARHPAEKHLADWTIVLDPGHGGDAHLEGYKRGPTGVREAEINWRVAVLLRRLLEEAGAHVVMTRAGDEDVSLAARAAVANEVVRRRDGGTGADLFLSLHHNASPRPETNFSSIWLHGRPEWAEPELDVARHLATRLGAALRTDVGVTSPLMSDLQMYGTGFGVLRMTRVPAVLLESSFHSNPEEEQRLRDAFYNLREAYAIYEGLAEYAYGGRPTQATPVLTESGDRVVATTTLDDGLPDGWWGNELRYPLPSTVRATLDGRPVETAYDPATGLLEATLEGLAVPPGGEAILQIHHANVFKHHNHPQRYRVSRADDGSLQAQPLGPERVAVEETPAASQVSSGEGR